MPLIDPLQFPVSESSQVGDARRQASSLAGALGLDETWRAEVAIVVTELGNNLVRHATGGELLVRSLHGQGDALGVEVISIDRGPGIASLDVALRDGFSTGGTPGTGLGAVRRLASVFEVHSSDSGTAVLARLWAGETPPAPMGLEVGVVCLPKPGEQACGDAWTVEYGLPGRAVVMIADGLGHGLQAADASRTAVHVLRENLSLDPPHRMQALHAALRHTRGAAVAIAELRLESREIRFTGVGNVAATVLGGAMPRNLVSHNGTIGAEARRIQEFTEPWPMDGLLVMHSDGLGSQWRLEKYPGLRHKHPALVAAILYRDFRRERDDVTVLALR